MDSLNDNYFKPLAKRVKDYRLK